MAKENEQRIFSQQYLDDVGVITVELIERKLELGNLEGVDELIDQFNREIQTMYFSYRGWEKVIKKAFVQRHEESVFNELCFQILEECEKPLEDDKKIRGKWRVLYQQLVNATAQKKMDDIKDAGRKLYDDAMAVHDQLMNYVASLLGELFRRYGQQILDNVLSEVMNPKGMNLEADMPFQQKVETIIHYTRCHLLPFKLIEDDEKVTFIADPCPSGGRLLLKGLYDDCGRGATLKGEQPLTYGLSELPTYCCHESAMEILSIKESGAPLFIVDPSVELGRIPCHVYIYKQAQNIPERFYQRLGLKKPDDLIALSR